MEQVLNIEAERQKSLTLFNKIMRAVDGLFHVHSDLEPDLLFLSLY